ncbi:hypothetical protein L2E82_45116 [Cichorium intybus]|uniref:Uncharacterized protein n=1 Tax=Cichorium intybus TaxID=13427 RepID=A0ACB8ZSN1_CICIN|nr:hypothetical protein L2E82_45116 [Cichorium intybus]
MSHSLSLSLSLSFSLFLSVCRWCCRSEQRLGLQETGDGWFAQVRLGGGVWLCLRGEEESEGRAEEGEKQRREVVAVIGGCSGDGYWFHGGRGKRKRAGGVADRSSGGGYRRPVMDGSYRYRGRNERQFGDAKLMFSSTYIGQREDAYCFNQGDIYKMKLSISLG